MKPNMTCTKFGHLPVWVASGVKCCHDIFQGALGLGRGPWVHPPYDHGDGQPPPPQHLTDTSFTRSSSPGVVSKHGAPSHVHMALLH